MIYTCYEMIRDCRAGRREGWSFFVTRYVPAIRLLLDRYFPAQRGNDALLGRVLMMLHQPDSDLFSEPDPERVFLARLRQHLVNVVEAERMNPEPDIALDLDTLAAALDPIPLVEKQAVWLETMHYDPAETSRLLSITPESAGRMRDHAAGLIREKSTAWRRSVIADSGAVLGFAASARSTPDCVSDKMFLDMLDGRVAWSGRESAERHCSRCWRCVDAFCRMREATHIVRVLKPLSGEEAAPYHKMLGIVVEKPSFWERTFRRK